MPADGIDLGSVLEHYGVDYHPGRRTQKVLCPVHEERVPSCSIDLDKGLYNCHACNARGDGYNLIMEKERCDFASAVEHAKKFARAGSGGVLQADDARRPGLFGRSRPGRRSGNSRSYRPRLYSDGRP